MSKLTLLCAFLAIASAKIIAPRDLADEVEEQVGELQAIVQGEISVAHDDLDNLAIAFGESVINTSQNGELSIQQQWETIQSLVEAIKSLAESTGYDISSCTNVREETLNRLPARYTLQMTDCMGDIRDSANRAARDARYIVDIVINKVHDLQNQVRRCRGDILCLSPLVTEIQMDKVRLPQNIKTEVLATQGLMNTMGISVQSCADDNVSGYVAEAYSIVGDIEACVNRIIG